MSAPTCPDCGMSLARFTGPGCERGWTCVRCDEPHVTPPATNALGRLRARLGVAIDELARRLSVSAEDADAIEATAFRLLEIDTIDRYVGALGCRLDVVAVHIDGFAVWLSDDERGLS